MNITSFYSYKGGVGRTVALLNTAWHLTRLGSCVALLDLDLEAPGLHDALLAHNENDPPSWKTANPKKGFYELVEHFWMNQDLEEFNVEARNSPGDARARWDPYLTRGLGPHGRLSLLPAAGTKSLHNGDLKRWVQEFDWFEFYEKGAGRDMMELLVWFLRIDHDYLLVDARTGMTDVRDISLFQLPDLAVLVTNLSDQSVLGIREQLTQIKRLNEKTEKTGTQKRRIGAERRPVQTLLVGSPLPTGEWAARQERLREIARKLGTPDHPRPLDIQVDYLPLLALDERYHIPAQHLDSTPGGSDELLAGATRTFEALAREIARRNPESPENLVEDGNLLINHNLWRWGLAHCDEAADRLGDIQGDTALAARLAKIRAQLQGLETDAAHRGLEDLDCPSPPEQQLDVGQVWLALSSTLILTNDFEGAAGAADQAHKKARAAWKEASWDTVPRDLMALARVRRAYARALCSQWDKAQEDLIEAEKTYRDLAARPLLHALCLGEKARVEVARKDPKSAKNSLESGEGLLSGKGGIVKSDYVQAHLAYARFTERHATGHLQKAREHLDLAFKLFRKEADLVGQVEVVVEAADKLGLVPAQDPAPGFTKWSPHGDSWDATRKKAREMRIPRADWMLELLALGWRQAVSGVNPDDDERILARLFNPDDREPSFEELSQEDKGDWPHFRRAPAFPSQVRLQACRYRLLQSSLKHARTLLERVKQTSDREKEKGRELHYELRHEYLLLRAIHALLYEVKGGTPEIDALADLRQHEEDLDEKGLVIDRLHCAVVRCLYHGWRNEEPGGPTLEQVRNTIPDHAALDEFYWHRPIAFLGRLCRDERMPRNLGAAWHEVKNNQLHGAWPELPPSES